MVVRKRRQFTEEFKAATVRLVREEGKATAAVARELDLTESPVWRWVRQAKIEVGHGPPGALTRAEREELVRLRRENRQLQMEREILKSRGLLCQGTRMKSDFIVAQKADYPVTTLCRVLQVSRSAVYVLDLFARRVIGWALAPHLRTELVSAAFTMAVGRRQPPTALVRPSDRGTQYASAAYQRLLQAHGIIGSVSRAGNCWDNAVVESFFASLKTELVDRLSWPTRAAAHAAIAEYLEVFYNNQRLHSYLDYRTPMEAEKAFMLTAAKAA